MSLKDSELITYLQYSAITANSTANAVCTPLNMLYTKCLRDGVFPNECKVANITPVHKGAQKMFQLFAMVLYDLSYSKYDYAPSIGMPLYRIPYQAQKREARPHQLFAINYCRIIAGTRPPMCRLV
ncbi:hypothetical protein EVAR_38460_1 [Eumeta japonica]|uniref:Uncharacterized protein n=1 Tax=Eumeta variegata TaxID=151549 RepID=A0A4C1WQD5_EUMVA|nr:hypothetical protein EVAR_38460_1 [Eumeta japonica]